MFHYPVLNDAVPTEDPLPNVLLDKEEITEETQTIHKICGVITDMPVEVYTKILKHMLKQNGTFCMSEQYDYGHVNLLR